MVSLSRHERDWNEEVLKNSMTLVHLIATYPKLEEVKFVDASTGKTITGVKYIERNAGEMPVWMSFGDFWRMGHLLQR